MSTSFEAVRLAYLGISRLVLAYFLSQNTIHSTSRALFILPAEHSLRRVNVLIFFCKLLMSTSQTCFAKWSRTCCLVSTRAPTSHATDATTARYLGATSHGSKWPHYSETRHCRCGELWSVSNHYLFLETGSTDLCISQGVLLAIKYDTISTNAVPGIASYSKTILKPKFQK
jgi:hypothetical protein